LPIARLQIPMDGILLIDKPSGPTSHDVVARLRGTSREKSIGHTGTLDPRATGLLPLVCGRATRLASLLSGEDKGYDATIRLGWATDTDDVEGQPIGSPSSRLPSDDELQAATLAFQGTFAQTPPTHSAKRLGGHKAYELARQAAPVALRAVPVTVRAFDVTGRDGAEVRIRVTATAGFYVRALARDLGEKLGCGAHLLALRRTRSGAFDVADAVPLAEAERMGRDVAARVIAPAEALPNLPAVQVTALGLKRAVHGNALGPEHLEGRWVPPHGAGGPVRVLGPDGRLIALAHSRGGALHPAVVLG
jgi:tRNA pseudouridine55 synthase